MHVKTTKSFICVEMLEEGYKFFLKKKGVFK
jgi:hypothetical protein